MSELLLEMGVKKASIIIIKRFLKTYFNNMDVQDLKKENSAKAKLLLAIYKAIKQMIDRDKITKLPNMINFEQIQKEDKNGELKDFFTNMPEDFVEKTYYVLDYLFKYVCEKKHDRIKRGMCEAGSWYEVEKGILTMDPTYRIPNNKHQHLDQDTQYFADVTKYALDPDGLVEFEAGHIELTRDTISYFMEYKDRLTPPEGERVPDSVQDLLSRGGGFVDMFTTNFLVANETSNKQGLTEREKAGMKGRKWEGGKNFEVLYEDDHSLIIIPKTADASAYFGRSKPPFAVSLCVSTFASWRSFFESYTQGGKYNLYFWVKKLKEGDPKYLIKPSKEEIERAKKQNKHLPANKQIIIGPQKDYLQGIKEDPTIFERLLYSDFPFHLEFVYNDNPDKGYELHDYNNRAVGLSVISQAGFKVGPVAERIGQRQRDDILPVRHKYTSLYKILKASLVDEDEVKLQDNVIEKMVREFTKWMRGEDINRNTLADVYKFELQMCDEKGNCTKEELPWKEILELHGCEIPDDINFDDPYDGRVLKIKRHIQKAINMYIGEKVIEIQFEKWKEILEPQFGNDKNGGNPDELYVSNDILRMYDDGDGPKYMPTPINERGASERNVPQFMNMVLTKSDVENIIEDIDIEDIPLTCPEI